MTASRRALPNALGPPCSLHTFLKSISLTEVPNVMPLFASQTGIEDSVSPVGGSKILRA